MAAMFVGNSLAIDDDMRDVLFALIAREVLVQGMREDFGAELDDTQVEVLLTQITLERDSLGLSTADFLGVPNASDALMRFDAEIAVLRRQAVDALVSDPEYLDSLFADPTLYTRVCSFHILLETEEEADAALARVQGGEAFSAVADDVSTDTGVGGDLGCRLAGEFVDEFAAAVLVASLGEPHGPVESPFGWHVILVTERSAPTREEIAGDPASFIPAAEASAQWQQWITAKIQAAEVVVEPRYGIWSPLGILPPER